MKQKAYRKLNRLTLAEFASLVGISVPAVWRYEHGRVPRTKHLLRIIQISAGRIRFEDYADDAAEFAKTVHVAAATGIEEVTAE